MEAVPLLLIPYPLSTFLLFFTAVYLLGYFLIFRKWTPATRPQASSCLLSLLHGTPALLLSTLSLLQQIRDYPKSHFMTTTTTTTTTRVKVKYFFFFASRNTPLQNLTFDYSTAYFLADLLHYLLFVPNDHLFIAHHAATLYVFLTCRYVVNHGAFPLLLLLVLAELTSACQNVWTLAGFRRRDSPVAAALYRCLSPMFYAVYAVVRGVVGPVLVWEMGVFYLRQQEEAGGSWGGRVMFIPTWVWGSWILVIGTAILGSVLWVWNRWLEWLTLRTKKN